MINRRARMIQYIMDRIDVVPGPLDTPCQLWTGGDSGDGRGGGYGRMTFEGATYAVHRARYILEEGPIPDKVQLDHLCENRRCCAPDHLEPVSHICNQHRRSFPKLASQLALDLHDAEEQAA
ncbi:MAG: HNH endonuclease signature motif containing protein [Pseudomonadota bacterium]|nr:HNH endonuclease signature motif containing protein [Pseudomonadota bacterium]